LCPAPSTVTSMVSEETARLSLNRRAFTSPPPLLGAPTLQGGRSLLIGSELEVIGLSENV
jgi:hypothetical protein